MTKYVVNVIMSSYVEIDVTAQDEEEAQSIALNMAHSSMADEWDYEVDCVYRDGDDDDEEEE